MVTRTTVIHRPALPAGYVFSGWADCLRFENFAECCAAAQRCGYHIRLDGTETAWGHQVREAAAEPECWLVRCERLSPDGRVGSHHTTRFPSLAEAEAAAARWAA